jgi:hypothetical protein
MSFRPIPHRRLGVLSAIDPLLFVKFAKGGANVSKYPRTPDLAPSASSPGKGGLAGYIVVRSAPGLPAATAAWVAEGEILKRSELTDGMLCHGYGETRGIAVATGRMEQHAGYGQVELYEVRPQPVA